MARRAVALAAFFAVLAALFASAPAGVAPRARAQTGNPCEPWPICKINHVVFIVQENRSFDHYFGTYESPGGQNVAGIPRKPDGTFNVCIPNPVRGICQKPYHSTNLYNAGGPHSRDAALADMNNGQMNGFIRVGLWAPRTAYCIKNWALAECNPLVGPKRQPDVISYHTRKDIPNYWAYADYGVLQDHMFEPVASWTLPSHLYLVSGWAASCTDDRDASTCHSDPKLNKAWNYPWADITILLRKYGLTWNYFVGDGTDLACEGRTPATAAPDTDSPAPKSPCNPAHDGDATTEGWMPIKWFQSVKEASVGGRERVSHVSDFFTNIGNGELANVTWFIPPPRWSEHPGHASIRPGERYVTKLVNAIGESPFWDDTAIFLTWDDWGGFYDHMEPRHLGSSDDNMGYGLRVPGIMISPYAKESFVDHQELSFDAYLKFIEDRWMGSERLDGNTDGWHDPRPTVREDVPTLGDLSSEFDFTQSPRPAPILDPPAPKGPALWPYEVGKQIGFGAGG